MAQVSTSWSHSWSAVFAPFPLFALNITNLRVNFAAQSHSARSCTLACWFSGHAQTISQLPSARILRRKPCQCMTPSPQASPVSTCHCVSWHQCWVLRKPLRIPSKRLHSFFLCSALSLIRPPIKLLRQHVNLCGLNMHLYMYVCIPVCVCMVHKVMYTYIYIPMHSSIKHDSGSHLALAPHFITCTYMHTSSWAVCYQKHS